MIYIVLEDLDCANVKQMGQFKSEYDAYRFLRNRFPNIRKLKHGSTTCDWYCEDYGSSRYFIIQKEDKTSCQET